VSIALVATIAVPANARLRWLIHNASGSAQLGFHAVEDRTPSRRHMVVVRPFRNARKSFSRTMVSAPRRASAEVFHDILPAFLKTTSVLSLGLKPSHNKVEAHADATVWNRSFARTAVMRGTRAFNCPAIQLRYPTKPVDVHQKGTLLDR
jgi:hypothetical protein